MMPHTHFLFPFLIGIVFNKFGIISWRLAVVCGIVGVLVDLDHYIEYIINAKSNRFSLRGAWNNSIRFHRFSGRSLIHHWQGLLALTLVFLGISLFYWKVSLVLVTGYYSHLVLDYLHLKREKFLRLKVGKFFVKESYLELSLDVVLIILIVGTILI